MSKLLSRDEFREAVFERDHRRCVICHVGFGEVKCYPHDLTPIHFDAHHIIERRLWPDGGYYLDNGATVCESCHRECEMTIISVNQVREAAHITTKLVPPHLYNDQEYDKWGNIILPNGSRMKGELFNDPSVQKILNEGNVLSLFTDLAKYPRTFHLPWSENMNDDDRMMEDVNFFQGKRVIVTEKMDGENTTLYRQYYHTRSVQSRHHETQNWVKNFWGSIAHDIPYGWRICGENLFAMHSIQYENLPSYFMGFSVWDDRNMCLSWDDTLFWFQMLGITPVPVLYDGEYDEEKIKFFCQRDWNQHEGYVIRIADEFPYGHFRKCVGKFVRKNHIQTVQHWKHGRPWVKNWMKGDEQF